MEEWEFLMMCFSKAKKLFLEKGSLEGELEEICPDCKTKISYGTALFNKHTSINCQTEGCLYLTE